MKELDVEERVKELVATLDDKKISEEEFEKRLRKLQDEAAEQAMGSMSDSVSEDRIRYTARQAKSI
jgi:hypothetical protein